MSFRSLLVLLPFGIVLSSGCAVGMALSGHPDPNTAALSTGQDRSIVVLNLGQPAQTSADENGRVDVFHLERGDQQSVGRAAAHGIMDLLTLGLWELIGTPIEAVSGETFTLVVHYDQEDKVTRIDSSPGHSDF